MGTAGISETASICTMLFLADICEELPPREERPVSLPHSPALAFSRVICGVDAKAAGPLFLLFSPLSYFPRLNYLSASFGRLKSQRPAPSFPSVAIILPSFAHVFSGSFTAPFHGRLWKCAQKPDLSSVTLIQSLRKIYGHTKTSMARDASVVEGTGGGEETR